MTDISPYSRAWAEIDAGALRHNVALLHRRYTGGGRTRLMAVVKADAYGHGVGLVAPLAAQAGVTDFGVATVAEGAALRALLPQAAIYLIALTLPPDAGAIVTHRLTPLLSTREMGCALADAARAQGVTAQAHLEVDTGIGRAGAAVNDALPLLAAAWTRCRACKSPASPPTSPAPTRTWQDAQAQHAGFARLLRALGRRADALLVHADNSPAALSLPAETRHGLIRPGLLLYGIEPAPEMFAGADLPLRPVLSLRARVLLCRPLPGGATISYGKTYVVPPGGGVYATLGLGYGDGLPRRLSGGGYVLLHGRRAPICGRVCMDQVVVDVTDILQVRGGDAATIIGTDGGETITAGAVAAAVGTTPHEITTCLTARVPRSACR